MEFTDKAKKILNAAAAKANEFRHEFVTPEHVLIGLINDDTFIRALLYCNIEYRTFVAQLDSFMHTMEHVLGNDGYELIVSDQAGDMMDYAEAQALGAGQKEVDVPHLVDAILHLRDSQAHYLFVSNTDLTEAEIVTNVLTAYDEDVNVSDPDDDEDVEDAVEHNVKRQLWRELVTCVNDQLADHNPLIGREAELERTIQVLCRKDKNNPLHIGEPGVGKTALVYGLAALIEQGKVPERLKDYRIYSLDLGTLLAGTQFRGDFEKRIKSIMDGVREEGKAIIYIDEVHNLIGAGKGSDGAMDASNMLKPYLESGDIRFIGSTTYQEYNRYLAKSKGIVRRFQQIDIAEPSQEETVEILKGLKRKYEDYHSVTIPDDIIEYTVEMAARHISERFLPDKAIDILDEACAFRQVNPLLNDNGEKKTRRSQKIDRPLVNDILARVCKIDAKALKGDDNKALATLDSQLSAQIYGQQEAIHRVVESVQMSKAGLLEDNKPIASLLFVGPTGVGKTEVARVLAQELGIELVRFDMSEYTEKHTVAKLIGSPAGYVGYEDGGLLTDAIRKTPNCVLLLDEIEKAHSDIYNILLQVMDYARLTDNKGQKADFRNVIVIMTSNAGAQYASQANVGFSGHVSRGEAMMTQVKKTFKPEFINRLSSIVVFKDMDLAMANLILDKKLRQLDLKLKAKNIVLQLSAEARSLLLDKGFSPRYGAREIDRIIQQSLNPLLMREILFGKTTGGKSGGKSKYTVRTISIGVNDKALAII